MRAASNAAASRLRLGITPSIQMVSELRLVQGDGRGRRGLGDLEIGPGQNGVGIGGAVVGAVVEGRGAGGDRVDLRAGGRAGWHGVGDRGDHRRAPGRDRPEGAGEVRAAARCFEQPAGRVPRVKPVGQVSVKRRLGVQQAYIGDADGVGVGHPVAGDDAGHAVVLGDRQIGAAIDGRVRGRGVVARDEVGDGGGVAMLAVLARLTVA